MIHENGVERSSSDSSGRGASMNLSNFFELRFDSAGHYRALGHVLAALSRPLLRLLQRSLPQACFLCAAPSGNALLCGECTTAFASHRLGLSVCAAYLSNQQ
jgi:hypothetical protein